MSQPPSVSPPARVLGEPSNKKQSKADMQALLRQRDQLLREIYCVNRLTDILDITDEESFQQEISLFLKSALFPQNGRFDPKVLPVFKQTEILPKTVPLPYIITSPESLKDSRVISRHIDPADTKHIPLDEKSIPRESSSSKINTKESTPQEEALKAKLYKHTLDAEEDDGIKKKRKTDDRPSSSVTLRNKYLHNIDPMYYAELNLNPAEPTPIKLGPEYHTRLLSELTQPIVEEAEYFDKNNVNSKSLVYLLMKDKIPSKVAQAIPLAELKYLAHTLPLIKLLPMAHKALTTDIINNALNEGRITVVSSRIEELRRLGLWSLRQPKKFIDPWQQRRTHHDILLEEAKWMQQDFKEGQKYKIAMCATLAQAVFDYWTYGNVCCIQPKPIQHITPSSMENTNEITNENVNNEVNDKKIDSKEHNEDTRLSTNTALNDDQKESIEDDSVKIEERSVSRESSTATDKEGDTSDNGVKKVTSGANITEKSNLPETAAIDTQRLLEKPDVPQNTVSSVASSDTFKLRIGEDELNNVERAIINDVPLYCGINEAPPDQELPYAQISKSIVTLDDEHFTKLVEKQLVDEEQSLVQLTKRRGMFYGNRRSHYLKPPQAPSLRHLANRTPTIWLPEDDEELVKNINAYAYNWELIAAHMIHRPSMSYFSNIERRTPWQCFERFVQLNERFNFSDLKGPRAHAAQQWLIEAHKFQQKQNRRISPLGVSVESIQRGHRRLRWASMFEAIRKNMKKRENAPRPNPTQPRKPLDCKHMNVPTPAEMSILKAQRDEALRRDVQMRKTAKSRIQQQQMQSSRSQSRQNPERPSQSNANKSTSVSSQSIKANPLPIEERKFIEEYTKKILQQSPDLPLESAMKAAHAYYKATQENQLKDPQSMKASPASPSSSISKVKSPTPQEILEKHQKT